MRGGGGRAGRVWRCRDGRAGGGPDDGDGDEEDGGERRGATTGRRRESEAERRACYSGSDWESSLHGPLVAGSVAPPPGPAGAGGNRISPLPAQIEILDSPIGPFLLGHTPLWAWSPIYVIATPVYHILTASLDDALLVIVDTLSHHHCCCYLSACLPAPRHAPLSSLFPETLAKARFTTHEQDCPGIHMNRRIIILARPSGLIFVCSRFPPCGPLGEWVSAHAPVAAVIDAFDDLYRLYAVAAAAAALLLAPCSLRRYTGR